ncbi:MAG: dihydropteroate synthase [Abditibacteriota bacterium]|nr:dihydropteroate synthase [Abditibacteriota bacterium]
MNFSQLLNKKPCIMGIINFSDNSFYEKSIFNSDNKEYFDDIANYSDIIDIGAESTRPGSSPISPNLEISRFKVAIDYFKKFNKPISIDTYKSEVAEFAINQGIDIINDISGGLLDNNMFNVIKDKNILYILGHIQNNPKNMQIEPKYNDVISEIKDHFKIQIKKLIDLGFPRERICLDPCIGFGKTLNHNIKILRNIQEFKELNYPVLIGTSRKSFHRELTEIKTNEDMLIATVTSNIYSIIQGVDIIRVHDVKEFVIIRDILEKLKSPTLF